MLVALISVRGIQECVLEANRHNPKYSVLSSIPHSDNI